MAGFKTHITYGAFTGISIATISYINDWTKNIQILIIVFLSSIIGSFLPDIDSDTGTPFKIIFGIMSIVGSSITFIYTFNNYPQNIEYVIISPILSYITIRYVLGFIFKKFTHHRGVYHSIPALFISFMISITIVNKFDYEILEQLLISIAVFAGFFSHLILDELYANTSFLGIPYKPNRAFGSSLEFISKSRFSTISAYLTLMLLIYINYNLLKDMYYLIM